MTSEAVAEASPEPSLARAFGIGDDEIEALIAPYVKSRFRVGDAEWRRWQRKVARGWRWRHWRRRAARLSGQGIRRQRAEVDEIYDTHWRATRPDAARADDKGTPMVWRDQGYVAEGQALKRLYLLIAMRAIAELRPARVLEVGCGNGQNLLALACRFPDIAFTGIDLTQAGIDAATALQAEPALPDSLIAFMPEPPRDPGAHRTVAFRQADAAALDFADNAFELVFTDLALEQMESVRGEALSELARVAARQVLMIEPFRDWNSDGARRDRIVALDYFAGAVADLAAHGMRVRVASGDMPAKMRLGVGAVLADVG